MFEAVAQSYKLFTSDNELPSSMITFVYQDHYGFMWIGTENGLVKYDGARFITYTHNPDDPNSLAHDYVTSLTEDKQGNLYLSTYAGIQVYNYSSNSFSNNVTWSNGSVFNENSNFIFCSSKGVVYSAGYSLCRMSFDGKHLVAYKLHDSSRYKNYTKILEDKQGNLWAQINGQNTIIRLRNERISTIYRFTRKQSALNDFIITSDGAIYSMAYGYGLMEYNPQKNHFQEIEKELGNHHINSIFSKGNKLFMTGEQTSGFIYDRTKHSLCMYNRVLGNTNLNPEECSIVPFVLDKDGNAWMGILQKGLLFMPADNSPFQYIGNRFANVDFIGKNPVSAIYIAHDESLWIGTRGDGVYMMKNNDRKNVVHIPKPANVTSFYEDSDGNMWITGANAGIYLYNPHTRELKKDIIKINGVAIPTAHDIKTDKHGNMWIGTMGHGLFCYDRKTNSTKHINQENQLIHKWITKLFVANNGNIWLGTYDGIECVNPNTNFSSKRFLKRTIVYDILEDERHTLWLATSAGLFNISTKGDTISHYNTQNGLPSQSLAALQRDKSGNLWVTSNHGLSMIDTKTQNVINFYAGDGLQGNEFCKNSSFIDKTGHLWFGGNNGITHFSTSEIHRKNNKLHIRIVAIAQGDKDLTNGSSSADGHKSGVPIFEAKSVTLPSNENSFSIYFATEELNSTDKVQFEYSLDNQAWQRLPVGIHSVTFSSLPTGAHEFSVRAVNNLYHSTVQKITITISPFWYETWWAKLLFVTIFIAFIVLFALIIRMRNLERNERMLTEKQKAVHDAQTRLFIDISHEIRTPLTLILGPIRKLLESDSDSVRNTSYNTIQRNANRILKLMDQMIDVRKLEKDVLSLHFIERDVVEIIENIYNDFVEQASMKDICLSFTHDDINELSVWVDPNYFDKIIINLVSNAIKYTPNGGNVTISLALSNNRNNAVISICDNGPGIPETEKERIFERFYRGQNTNGTSIHGSGIGLSLTHSLVLLHHGTIDLESTTTAPSGSRFTVSIPLGNKHLSEAELDSSIAMTKSPLTKDNAQYTPNKEIHQTTYSKTQYRILIIDDEEEILDYLTTELSPDFHITGCNNGKDALAILQQGEYDLVVSDLMMPMMSGEQLCHKIRQNILLNDIPIIMLTANSEESSMISGLKNGADDYIIKPVSIPLLRTRILNLLHNRQILYNNYSGKQNNDEHIDEIDVKSPDEHLIERVMRVINENLANPELTVEMVANNVGMSRVHLNRKLKELTNQTASDYIRNTRLKQAAILLSKGNYAVNQVATLVGFTNACTFTTAFRNVYGVSPKDYK